MSPNDCSLEDKSSSHVDDSQRALILDTQTYQVFPISRELDSLYSLLEEVQRVLNFLTLDVNKEDERLTLTVLLSLTDSKVSVVW